MKIITYNVNGLRSALSKGFTDWLAEELPDIVCLQETKAQPDQIPTLEFEALGYRSFFFLTSSMRTPKPIIKQWCDPLMTFHKHCSCYSLLTLR